MKLKIQSKQLNKTKKIIELYENGKDNGTKIR